MRHLFGPVTADRHAAPFSRAPPAMVDEHQRAVLSLAGFNRREVFLAGELRQGFADRQQ